MPPLSTAQAHLARRVVAAFQDPLPFDGDESKYIHRCAERFARFQLTSTDMEAVVAGAELYAVPSNQFETCVKIRDADYLKAGWTRGGCLWARGGVVSDQRDLTSCFYKVTPAFLKECHTVVSEASTAEVK